MHRRLWLSVVMVAAGASLLIAASFASAASTSKSSAAIKKGGIYKIATTGGSVPIDPQVAYVSTAWWFQYSTSARLLNYPDAQGARGAQLRPEVASKYTVSKNGRVYTFTIRKNFRFSDGSRVTPNSFKYAINRALNHDLGGPAGPFVTDPNGTEIVGAKAVYDGKSTNVSGVTAKGNKLIIRLKRPSGTFLSQIAMPFFQATSTKLPLKKEVTTVANTRTMPTAGPYAWSSVVIDKKWVLTKNRFYKSGTPGHFHPQRLAGVDLTWDLDEETCYLRTRQSQYDEGCLPAAHVPEVKSAYGTNRSRYWVKPLVGTGYLALNTSRGIFGGNPSLRKAVNWAVNRRNYNAARGLDAGQPWTHLLPPGMPGSITAKKKQPYSSTSNFGKAAPLARGHMKNGKITVWYRNTSEAGRNQYAIIRSNLQQLGFKSDDINAKGWDASIYDAAGKRGADYDMLVSIGWLQDYPDPYDFVNILLHGGYNIHDENNVNYSYFNNAKWDKKMDAAAKLVGKKRLRAYGKLDLDLAKQQAPLAAMHTYNNRYLFGDRVNTKCLVYLGVYADWSLNSMCLK